MLVDWQTHHVLAATFPGSGQEHPPVRHEGAALEADDDLASIS